MKTLSFLNEGRTQVIEVGKTYYFGEIWDGNGDGKELLESGAISPDNENTVDFEIVEQDEDLLKVLVKVTWIG